MNRLNTLNYTLDSSYFTRETVQSVEKIIQEIDFQIERNATTENGMAQYKAVLVRYKSLLAILKHLDEAEAVMMEVECAKIYK